MKAGQDRSAKAQKHRGAVQGKVIFLELLAKGVQGFLEDKNEH